MVERQPHPVFLNGTQPLRAIIRAEREKKAGVKTVLGRNSKQFTNEFNQEFSHLCDRMYQVMDSIGFKTDQWASGIPSQLYGNDRKVRSLYTHNENAIKKAIRRELKWAKKHDQTAYQAIKEDPNGFLERKIVGTTFDYFRSVKLANRLGAKNVFAVAENAHKNRPNTITKARLTLPKDASPVQVTGVLMSQKQRAAAIEQYEKDYQIKREAEKQAAREKQETAKVAQTMRQEYQAQDAADNLQTLEELREQMAKAMGEMAPQEKTEPATAGRLKIQPKQPRGSTWKEFMARHLRKPEVPNFRIIPMAIRRIIIKNFPNRIKEMYFEFEKEVLSAFGKIPKHLDEQTSWWIFSKIIQRYDVRKRIQDIKEAANRVNKKIIKGVGQRTQAAMNTALQTIHGKKILKPYEVRPGDPVLIFTAPIKRKPEQEEPKERVVLTFLMPSKTSSNEEPSM